MKIYSYEEQGDTKKVVIYREHFATLEAAQEWARKRHCANHKPHYVISELDANFYNNYRFCFGREIERG